MSIPSPSVSSPAAVIATESPDWRNSLFRKDLWLWTAKSGLLPLTHSGSEAALFRFGKVKTPTHLVQGGADIRVSYLEGVTMERALQALGTPTNSAFFPAKATAWARILGTDTSKCAKSSSGLTNMMESSL